jgi:1-deoxy-D-xylulose-5-phosphate synthase
MLAHALSLTGPSALRFARASDPDASLPGNDVPVAQGRGVLLRDGTDVAFVAYGTMVRTALEAATRLEAAGVSAAVFNARFARPLDGAADERHAHRVPLVVTLEEHSVQGGFGRSCSHSRARRTRGRHGPRVGVPDRLVPHGERADLLARFGLSAEAVADFVLRTREAARPHRR